MKAIGNIGLMVTAEPAGGVFAPTVTPELIPQSVLPDHIMSPLTATVDQSGAIKTTLQPQTPVVPINQQSFAPAPPATVATGASPQTVLPNNNCTDCGGDTVTTPGTQPAELHPAFDLMDWIKSNWILLLIGGGAVYLLTRKNNKTNG